MKELELVPYPRLVQRAVSNYRASLADSSGRILFLAGPPRSGRTRLLDDIARAIPTIDHKPDLLAGAAVNGMLFVASSANTRARLQDGASLLGTILDAAQYVPVAGPGLSLGGKFIQVAAGADKMFGPRRREGPFRVLEDVQAALRAATPDRPVVLLLDDGHQASGEVWGSLLGVFAAKELCYLPALIVVTTTDGLPPTSKDHTAWRRRADWLITQKLATWRPIPRLTEADIATVLNNAAPDLVRTLHEATGGNGRWVTEVWEEWRSKEYVVRDEQWHFEPGLDFSWLGSGAQIAEHALQSVFGAEGFIDDARAVLLHGAMQGLRFSPAVIGDVLGRSVQEIKAVCELMIRDETRPDALLLRSDQAGLAESSTPDQGRHYQFVSAQVCDSLLRYGPPTEVSERALAVAKAMQRQFEGDEELVAWELATLFELAGDEQTSHHYWLLLELGPWVEERVELARSVLESAREDWTRADYAHAAEVVIIAGHALRLTASHEQPLDLYEAAAELALKGDVPSQRAEATIHVGKQLNLAGRLKEAVSTSRRRNASVSRWATPGSRAGPPNTLAKRTGSSATMKRPRMRLNGPWRFGEAVKTRMRLRAFWPTSPAWRATRGGRIWRWRDIERPKDSKATRLLPTTGSAFSTGSRRSSQREILRKRGVTSDLLCAWPPNAGGRLAQHECSSRSASSTSKRDTFKTRAAG